MSETDRREIAVVKAARIHAAAAAAAADVDVAKFGMNRW